MGLLITNQLSTNAGVTTEAYLNIAEITVRRRKSIKVKTNLKNLLEYIPIDYICVLMSIKKTRSFTIGICGGSGSGKTTLLRRISESFKSTTPAVFSMDNYYLPIYHMIFQNHIHSKSWKVHYLTTWINYN